MDGKTIVFIIVVGGILLVVSFIGNKIVDGASNAMRPKKKNNPNGTPHYTGSGSLASRYSSSNAGMTELRPRYCDKCGEPLSAGKQFCSKCGREVKLG